MIADGPAGHPRARLHHDHPHLRAPAALRRLPAAHGDGARPRARGRVGVPHEPDGRELPQRLDGVPRGLPADAGHLPRGRGQLLMSATSISTAVVAFDAAGEPDANRLGGKGASLVKMVGLGMPVPPGFVLSTDIGREYLEPRRAPRRRDGARRRGAARLEQQLEPRARQPGRPPARLGPLRRAGLDAGHDGHDPQRRPQRRGRRGARPRLRATRSSPGAPTSACSTRSPRPCAGSPPASSRRRCSTPRPPGWSRGRRAASASKALLALIGDFPQAPRAQVEECINAVFGSWNSPRAKAYRKFRGIDDAIGTACVVQSMVFGNRHGDAAVGQRRRVLARPVHRRARGLRRDPLRRPGRGRRLRRPRRRAARRADRAPARARAASSTTSSRRSSARRAT